MKTQSLAFLLGILLLQIFPRLPDARWVGILLLLMIISKLLLNHKSHLFIATALGFIWSL